MREIEELIKANHGKKDDGQTIARRIWQTYFARLQVFVRSYAFDIEDREDLAQDIMLKVFSGLDDYKPGFAFSTWFYTLARNACIDHVKKNRRIKRSLFSIVQSEPSELNDSRYHTPDKIFQDKEQQLELGQLIDALDTCDRQIVFLKFYEGLVISEIAKIMKMPEGTVKYKLFEIRKNLKGALGAEYEYGT